jgi:pentatricopeptide repeat protein
MHNIPAGMKSMGKYGSMDEAKKAMSSMKECGG